MRKLLSLTFAKELINRKTGKNIGWDKILEGKFPGSKVVKNGKEYFIEGEIGRESLFQLLSEVSGRLAIQASVSDRENMFIFQNGEYTAYPFKW